MRLSLFQQYLKKEKIDLAFFYYSHDDSQDSNVVYFAGMKPSHALFVVQHSTARLYLTALDKKPTIAGVTVKTLTKQWREDVPRKVKRVGIVKSALTYEWGEKLTKMWPLCEFVDVGPFLGSLRVKKDRKEIDTIAKACQISVNAFEELMRELPRGTLQTEQDVALFLERSMKLQGGGVAFPTIAAMGKNAAVPHHVTSLQQLSRGFLLLDFGASFQNYCSDMSRTIYLGTPTTEEKEMYNLVRRSQEAARRVTKSGKQYFELDVETRRVLGKKSKYYIHALGHGVGIDVHEEPSFGKEKPWMIGKNHIFTLEPGVYFPGKYGIRIEDTLWWDGVEAKVLTPATKELITLSLPRVIKNI
ncbi:TPA: M24 family metallopeptidase [Candidatus Woesearchaeota archaeon]|nr:M24 family metallopeptidase [Candidatus Woesearchaeota archaeon]